MRRVWFKREMREAILAGRKTATTRTHALPLGEVLAVSGPRFKAVPFAVIEILDRIRTTVENVIAEFYREEGFDSPEAMGAFLEKERLPLLDAQNPVFFHRFKLLRIIQNPVSQESAVGTPTPTPTGPETRYVRGTEVRGTHPAMGG
jgi:hypothetical protein